MAETSAASDMPNGVNAGSTEVRPALAGEPAAAAAAVGAVPTPPVRDRNDPTEALVGVAPQPARLDRRTRDRHRAAAAATDGTAADGGAVLAADAQGQLQYRDRLGRPGRAQLGHATVSESDLGLAFYPGGQVQPGESRRVQDPAAGESVSVTQTSADALPAVAAFYRSRFAALAGAVVQEQDGGGTEPWSLSAAWPDGRLQTVTLLSDDAGTRVVLLRAQPAVPGRP